jgi:hypothetical protein
MTTRVLPLAVLAAIAVAGCGGGGDDVAGASGDTSDAKQLAWAACMRKEGIEVSDPGRNGRPTRIQVGRRISPQRMKATMQKCREQTGGGPREPTAEERQELQDAALRFARCMRRHGVDVPDPKAGGGGITIGGGPGKRLNPDSPRFQEAQKACQGLLPKGPMLQRSGKD